MGGCPGGCPAVQPISLQGARAPASERKTARRRRLIVFILPGQLLSSW